MPISLPFAENQAVSFPAAEANPDYQLATQADGVWSDGVEQLMATCVFQGADARYYSRNVLPKEVRDLTSGLMRNLTVGDIIFMGQAIANLTAPVGPEQGLDLIALTLSVMNKDEAEKLIDPAGDTADSDFEYQAKILVTDAARVHTQQFVIPGVETLDEVDAWFAANSPELILRNGERAAYIVSLNLSKQRAPRAM